MRQLFTFILTFLLSPFFTKAQFIIGGDNFFIESNTQIVIDGLTLKPANDLALIDQALTISNVPVSDGNRSSINRVYRWASPFLFSGNVGIFYRDSELNGNTKNKLQIFHSGNMTGSFAITSGSTVEPTSSYVSNSLISANLFGISAMDAFIPLPVKLTTFSVHREGIIAILDWETGSETNSSQFDVQHSLNSKDWNDVGKVMAKGENSDRQSYNFNHSNPILGEVNYYRLTMFDKDGSFAFSSIKSLEFTSTNQNFIYPNPTDDKFYFVSKERDKVDHLQITNISGSVNYDISLTGNLYDSKTLISMQPSTPGLYIITVHKKDGSKDSFKILRK